MVLPCISAFSDALSDVLNRYGTSSEMADISGYLDDLDRLRQTYRELRSEQSYNEFVGLIGEIADEMVFDSTNWAHQVEVGRKYLIALVNTEASLEEIFEAESSYREALRMYEEFSEVRRKYAADNFQLFDVSSTDLEVVAGAIYDLVNQIGNNSVAPDIGVIDDAISPLGNEWNIVSGYGYRSLPDGSGRQFHNGIDLAALQGDAVYALYAGKVLRVEEADDGSYGVVISHSDEFQTYYAHVGEVQVSVGDVVAQYAQLGVVQPSIGGSVHLHFGVFINGQKVDPAILAGGAV
jgi:murein DD-endopeptidase MepM/ murein hydrolase activator NlpD